ncbi:MAG: DUF485 domain-containing protein [Calditerrivibrio sp.]|nr:DUF485 domain-containing protein [Calditerrivibrio sp.]
MDKKQKEVLESERFKSLVRKKWTVSYILLFLLFFIYYGYIFLIASNKAALAVKIGVYTNVGIILGVLVIVGAWLLTAYYVWWANNTYDKEVEELKKML